MLSLSRDAWPRRANRAGPDDRQEVVGEVRGVGLDEEDVPRILRREVRGDVGQALVVEIKQLEVGIVVDETEGVAGRRESRGLRWLSVLEAAAAFVWGIATLWAALRGGAPSPWVEELCPAAPTGEKPLRRLERECAQALEVFARLWFAKDLSLTGFTALAALLTARCASIVALWQELGGGEASP